MIWKVIVNLLKANLTINETFSCVFLILHIRWRWLVNIWFCFQIKCHRTTAYPYPHNGSIPSLLMLRYHLPTVPWYATPTLLNWLNLFLNFNCLFALFICLSVEALYCISFCSGYWRSDRSACAHSSLYGVSNFYYAVTKLCDRFFKYFMPWLESRFIGGIVDGIAKLNFIRVAD